ncbi:hypothetical protein GTY83_00910 [Streptomyces sp. SID4928]|uniref:hypothetical protein n=1 Tax=Streptomyces TaxID=1883 RepID=UPI0002034624|nr:MULTISPECIES: hypothetical protein [Streptomyces]EGE39594.1 hypothetical protein SACT1_0184 [Streptomyces sp. ACT-1]MYR47685.1 hypothetical protein [Streptomyces sp. SID4928]
MREGGHGQQGGWVVLGGAHLLNRTAPPRDEDTVALVHVPGLEVTRPATTVTATWRSLGPTTVHVRTAGGAPLASGVIDGSDLWSHAMPAPALRKLVGPAPGLTPLCYLAPYPDGYHVYAQIRFHPEDACFVRTTPEPVGAGPVEELRWLQPALRAHSEHHRALNNHRRYFRTHMAGTELEIKYTLDPAPDIWDASMSLLKALRDGELEGCRPEYRDEFQINHTENHLFDVTGPETEIGYASFIPTVTAGHVLKRKWYTQDAFARREELTSGIDVRPDSFETYLRDQLGLEVEALPSFERVRYDIQCESMRTGHIFGIFLDRCSLLTAPDIGLSQCELEYLRSRSVLDTTDDELLPEMERISRWLGDHLAARSWATGPTYYSKRTFLRDVVAQRPDLSAKP